VTRVHGSEVARAFNILLDSGMG